MKRLAIFLASFLGLVAGCASPAASIPTPYPPEYLPTVIAMTAQSAEDSATATFIASIPTVTPTSTPTPTSTITPGPTYTPTSVQGHAPAVIQIGAPGPMSNVVSPISLHMNIKIGDSQSMQVDLYGEDGRLLSRITKKVPPSNHGAPQSVKIPFEIRATGEVGRVTISTLDKFDRIQALNSVRVLLLSTGENEIMPAGNPSEPVAVFSPVGDESASGGILSVSGDIWPFNLLPVFIELVDPEGKSLGLRILEIESLTPQLFETTIPYKVTAPTLARLTIRQDDDRLPGLFYVYSQEVLLNP